MSTVRRQVVPFATAASVAIVLMLFAANAWAAATAWGVALMVAGAYIGSAIATRKEAVTYHTLTYSLYILPALVVLGVMLVTSGRDHIAAYATPMGLMMAVAFAASSFMLRSQPN